MAFVQNNEALNDPDIKCVAGGFGDFHIPIYSTYKVVELLNDLIFAGKKVHCLLSKV